jgi:hypothetical protein
MSRQTLVDGVDANGTINASQGCRLSYDLNGNRVKDASAAVASPHPKDEACRVFREIFHSYFVFFVMNNSFDKIHAPSTFVS